MEWTFDYLPHRRIVRATTSGTVTRNGVLKLAREMARHLKERRASKFLVDHRAAVVRIGLGELYFLPRDAAAIGITSQYKGAFVFSEGSPHDFKFYENVASNSGYSHGVFTDLDAALAWLDME